MAPGRMGGKKDSKESESSPAFRRDSSGTLNRDRSPREEAGEQGQGLGDDMQACSGPC